MSSMSHGITSLALAGLLSTGLSRAAAAADSTTVAPLGAGARSRNAIYIAGGWSFQGHQSTAPRAGWVWVPGHWENPPVPGAQYEPGHWGFAGAWYSWIPGYWQEPRGVR